MTLTDPKVIPGLDPMYLLLNITKMERAAYMRNKKNCGKAATLKARNTVLRKVSC